MIKTPKGVQLPFIEEVRRCEVCGTRISSDKPQTTKYCKPQCGYRAAWKRRTLRNKDLTDQT